MNTIDLNTYRNELAREILATDSIEVLETVYRAYRKAVSKAQKSLTVPAPEVQGDEFAAHCNEETAPYYTLKELNDRIDEAEAQIAAGEILSNEEADAELKEKLPWLK